MREAQATRRGYAALRRRLDEKTKPRGSLGRLEDLGCRVAAIRGFVPDALDAGRSSSPPATTASPREGVSAPTRRRSRAQMVANFAAGGAAINVLARQAGADLVVVDAGVVEPVEHELGRARPAHRARDGRTCTTGRR